jgi:hypothetical protein
VTRQPASILNQTSPHPLKQYPLAARVYLALSRKGESLEQDGRPTFENFVAGLRTDAPALRYTLREVLRGWSHYDRDRIAKEA